ncbi:hypothetical protein Xmlh_03835 [Xanthomonas axonopodis pv. melhusii]|uniref:Uncharacterized protein n=1 Tax=Xanthomonas axonopodis pv. melhusii TaxID=487834 RepID=A0A1T1NX18_9XANT|nr:hypothetical protein [Xanthomonas axonopodis]OOW67703.1 hypothetical protein Xmlh_03835 [Xanthomonas axonopodis pv. melhusii]
MSNFIFDLDSVKRPLGKLLLSIQTERNTDLLIVQDVISQVKELARALKGRDLIPREILYELHTAIKILRAEIPHLKNGVDGAIKAANEIELAFDLILRGECHGDRVPGVPRII